MYSREKQFRAESNKSKKSHRNSPSFSSSLLDEICRSIDDKPETKTPETARFSRVEKWMESDRTVSRRRTRSENAVFPDNEPLVFSSTSTSSDSSAGLSSTSDAELFSNRPKPVRTTRGGDREKDCYLFDEYEEHERRNSRGGGGGGGGDDDLIKSKSRAMKIYANLKKMKHPVSPGARLTSFFNSIFSGLNRKKQRDADRRSSAAPSPAKMLTRCSTKSTDRTSVSIERTVRIDLARVVAADRDVLPRGKMSVGDGRPPLPPTAFLNRRKFDLDKLRNEVNEDEDDDDAMSESSSDLFELDYLSLNKDKFCEELPVYETTYFDKNRRLFR